ncbi:hypothetical protein [Brevibacillus sp. 179-C1.2 HS]
MSNFRLIYVEEYYTLPLMVFLTGVGRIVLFKVTDIFAYKNALSS